MLGESLVGLIWRSWCWCCCFFGLIIMRCIDVCVAADEVDGDGDNEEIRVRFPCINMSNSCSCAISGGGGGGRNSLGWCCRGGEWSWALLECVFFSTVVIEPLVFINDRDWLDVSGVARVKELFKDLLPLKWWRSFWKWEIGLTGVIGGRSLAAVRAVGGEAWTNKLLAIIVDDAVEGEGGEGDMDRRVLVEPCARRLWTKRSMESLFVVVFCFSEGKSAGMNHPRERWRNIAIDFLLLLRLLLANELRDMCVAYTYLDVTSRSNIAHTRTYTYSTFHDDMSYRLSVCVCDYHTEIDRSDMNAPMNEKARRPAGRYHRIDCYDCLFSCSTTRRRSEPNGTGQDLKRVTLTSDLSRASLIFHLNKESNLNRLGED